MAFAPAVPVSPESNPVPIHKLQIYAKAALPDATAMAGAIIVVIDGGAANAPCVAVSDGVGWFVVAVGSAVA
jgi:hypothetical protein